VTRALLGLSGSLTRVFAYAAGGAEEGGAPVRVFKEPPRRRRTAFYRYDETRRVKTLA